jgi:transposase
LKYYRQEKQFERIGVSISGQDMSNWQRQVWEKLDPLYSLMKKALKLGSVMQMDETTVPVMGGKKGGATRRKVICGWPAGGRLTIETFLPLNLTDT